MHILEHTSKLFAQIKFSYKDPSFNLQILRYFHDVPLKYRRIASIGFLKIPNQQGRLEAVIHMEYTSKRFTQIKLSYIDPSFNLQILRYFHDIILKYSLIAIMP